MTNIYVAWQVSLREIMRTQHKIWPLEPNNNNIPSIPISSPQRMTSLWFSTKNSSKLIPTSTAQMAKIGRISPIETGVASWNVGEFFGSPIKYCTALKYFLCLRLPFCILPKINPIKEYFLHNGSSPACKIRPNSFFIYKASIFLPQVINSTTWNGDDPWWITTRRFPNIFTFWTNRPNSLSIINIASVWCDFEESSTWIFDIIRATAWSP